MLSDAELALATVLANHGLVGSVESLLAGQRGGAANDLRARARAAPVTTRIFVLTTCRGGTRPFAIPVTAVLSRFTSFMDERAASAVAAGLTQARELLDAPRHLHPSLKLSADVDVEGESLGLGAFLAFVSLLSDASVQHAVFATGELGDGGTIIDVGHVEEKRRVALLDAGRAKNARILVPPTHRREGLVVPVRSTAEALDEAFGRSRLTVDLRLVDLASRLREIDNEPSHEVALGLLRGIALDHLEPVDRASVHLQRAMRLRHLGRTGEALQEHGEAAALAAGGADAIEDTTLLRLEIELSNSRLDTYELDEPIAELVRIVRERRPRGVNALYARGTLSRAYAMAGRAADALSERLALMPLHEKSDELRREKAASLAHLAIASARAGRADLFDETVREMVALPRHLRPPGQDGWDTAASVRGGVLLGRHADVCGWFDGRELPSAAPVSTRFAARGDDAITGYPDPSTARAVVRALRRCGRSTEAALLASRVARTGSPLLLAWIGALAQLEQALALRELGSPEADAVRADARERLRASHPAATRRHPGLLSDDPATIEDELDRVYY